MSLEGVYMFGNIDVSIFRIFKDDREVLTTWLQFLPEQLEFYYRFLTNFPRDLLSPLTHAMSCHCGVTVVSLASHSCYSAAIPFLENPA